jgi:hypothetical protein
MLANHYNRKAVRVSIAATLLSLCAVTIAAGRANNADSRTVVVALDRDAYLARDMTLLEDQVTEAAQSQSDRVGIAGGEGKVTITIFDLAKDSRFRDTIEKLFAGSIEYSVSRVPAITMRISYSDSALKTYSSAQLARDVDGLVEYVKTLRTPLSGVAIEAQSDGAIVRSTDPSFVDVMTKTLGMAFVIAPMSKTSWHVTWNVEGLKAVPPGRQMEFVAETATEVRRFLGDPLDLQYGQTSKGLEITIPNPELHAGFIENVRHDFARNPGFVLSESPALVLTVVQSGEAPQKPESQTDSLLPEGPSRLLEEIEALANPPVNVAVVGNAVWCSAKDPFHNSDRAAIVRQALSTRTDLVIETQPDQSLRISLAPGARLGPPIPSLQQGQLVDVVKARTNTLKLRLSRVSALDTEHVRATFPSVAAANSFRSAVSQPFGISIRMVDNAQSESATAPPSPGDEQLVGPDGDTMWVRPEAIITSGMFADARSGENKQTQSPDVEFRLTDEGRERFASATRQYLGRRFAIVVDGKVIETPMITGSIAGGIGEITGNFTPDSAQALVQLISSHKGDLPLKVARAGR